MMTQESPDFHLKRNANLLRDEGIDFVDRGGDMGSSEEEEDVFRVGAERTLNHKGINHPY